MQPNLNLTRCFLQKKIDPNFFDPHFFFPNFFNPIFIVVLGIGIVVQLDKTAKSLLDNFARQEGGTGSAPKEHLKMKEIPGCSDLLLKVCHSFSSCLIHDVVWTTRGTFVVGYFGRHGTLI